jgi:hypothetical protein
LKTALAIGKFPRLGERSGRASYRNLPFSRNSAEPSKKGIVKTEISVCLPLVEYRIGPTRSVISYSLELNETGAYFDLGDPEESFFYQTD